MTALEYLSRVLLARIQITNCTYQPAVRKWRVPEMVVPTPRLILLRAGSAQYTIENHTFALKAGMMLLVPARTRREWHSRKGCAAAWVEFVPAIPEVLMKSHLLLPSCDQRLESESFARVLNLFALKDTAHALRAEGEFKAILARFLSQVKERGASGTRDQRGFGLRSIERAVEWLGANFAQADALARLPERVNLSPNHFRLLFKKKMGISAQNYLLTLRMRAARSLLQESDLPVKAVAQAVGYADQLYFSRQYRAFWMATPSSDRVFRP
jgi:AraC-like DNA-binding protein